MDALRQSSTDEVGRLRGYLDDLVAITSLPALWTGGEPTHIVSTTLDTLLERLRLAFACVRLNDPEGGPAFEVVRVAQSLDDPARAREITAAIDSSLGETILYWPPRAKASVGNVDLSLVSARLGPHGEIGAVVVASQTQDFPDDTERLLVDVAASQAAVGLRQAHLLSEQKRLASDLAGRIAQRTNELEAATERLKEEVAERRRTEEILRERERESRLILDNIPGLVALLSATGSVEVVNRQLMQYFGQTLAELRHWGTNGTVHLEDLPHVIEVFSRSIESGRPYKIVQRFRRADGVYRWFENSGYPLSDAAGRIVRWCVLLTDIDERRRVEDALRESERESRLIVDSIPGLIGVFSPQGELEFVNRQGLEFFGRTLEELQRWGTNDLTHPEDRPRAVEHFTHAVSSGMAFDMEVRAQRFDGVYRWVQSRGSSLRDTNGEIVRWYNLIIDIDERKRAEEALAASEHNLKLIIDTIPVLAWSTRPDGSADFFNRHYLEFVGLSTEQASGWGWTAAVHPDDVDGLAAIWQRVLASEQRGEAEARLRRQDGEYRWFLFRVEPLRDEAGNVVKWYGVNTDIEDRKLAEVELRRAYDSFAEAQRLSKTGSFITDLVGDDHNWSEQTYRIFDFEPETKVSVQRIQNLIHPDDLPSFRAMIMRAMTGENVTFAFRIVTERGTLKHIRGVAHVIERVEGRPMFVGALQDATESVAAEEALNRARSELAHVTRVTTLSALTASIAHEVNQPLSGIVTNASTCLRMLDADPPDIDGARQTARRTIRDGNRVSDVITRLRALFSKKELTLEVLDLNEATREVVALSLSELQQDRVVLRAELADDLPTITGDRIQLQQVILNLLRNAADAMVGVHDRPRHLLIKTEREGDDRVRLVIRDAGIGLPPQPLDSLFDPFHTTKSDGMGIGLFVSRSIIERHRGRLWAEPNNGGPGATFAFSIPCAAENIPDADSVSRTS